MTHSSYPLPSSNMSASSSVTQLPPLASISAKKQAVPSYSAQQQQPQRSASCNCYDCVPAESKMHRQASVPTYDQRMSPARERRQIFANASSTSPQLVTASMFPQQAARPYRPQPPSPQQFRMMVQPAVLVQSSGSAMRSSPPVVYAKPAVIPSMPRRPSVVYHATSPTASQISSISAESISSDVHTLQSTPSPFNEPQAAALPSVPSPLCLPTRSISKDRLVFRQSASAPAPAAPKPVRSEDVDGMKTEDWSGLLSAYRAKSGDQ